MSAAVFDYPERAAVEKSLSNKLIMLSPEGHKALGLAAAIGGLRVVTCSDEQVCDALRAHGADVVSVSPREVAHTTEGLLGHTKTTAALERWGRGPALVFRPDHGALEALAALGFEGVSARPEIARHLENKRAFRRFCRDHAIPTLDTVEIVWPPASEADALRDGVPPGPRVVQTPRGHAGKRTWLWSPNALPALPDELVGKRVLVSPFVDGPTFTMSAVAMSDRVVTGFAMRQVSGDPRLDPNPFASCGVEMGTSECQALAEELAGLTRRVGESAQSLGFMGHFGIDAVGEPGDLRVIEMNPRLTASLTAATFAELSVCAIPLTVLHLGALLGFAALAEADVLRPQAPPPCGHLIGRRAPSDAVFAAHAHGTYGTDGAAFVKRSASMDWPGPGHFTLWPAGAGQGGPVDERYRLLLNRPFLQEGRVVGPVAEFLERTVDFPTGAA